MPTRLLLPLALIAVGSTFSAARPIKTASSVVPDSCIVPPAETARLLALSYEEFDTDSAQFSWRSLNGRNCTNEAIRLLERYTAARSAELSAGQKSEAAFHAGQALTFANRNEEAIAYFEKALAMAREDEWSTYVMAHLAYARGDLASLRRASEHYAEIAPGSMRLGFLKGLLACPQKPYMEAAHCRP
jgi:tetratricopeptide (TPR) repeat protein